MAHLGYSYDAITYATMAGPRSITWLTMADAQANGIAVRLFQPDPPAAPVAPVVAQQPQPWAVPNQQPRPALRAPVAPQAVAIGPSFDCARADRPVMKFICADADLSRIDVVFLQPYYVLRHQVGPSGWKALMVEAIDFQNATEQSCGISPTGDLPVDLAALKNCMYIQYTNQRAIWMARLSGPGLQEASRPIETAIALQTRLQLLGYIPVIEKIDGIYGTGTRAAIISWQIAASLQPTGLLGDSDASALAQSQYHAQR
jgi:peptidoglycan hydrolase-like protein with peptidoglycan-binding domain